jgi:hypothetical protein
MKLQFSIRDLLWLTLVIGMAVAWRIDHRRNYQQWEVDFAPASGGVMLRDKESNERRYYKRRPDNEPEEKSFFRRYQMQPK